MQSSSFTASTLITPRQYANGMLAADAYLVDYGAHIIPYDEELLESEQIPRSEEKHTATSDSNSYTVNALQAALELSTELKKKKESVPLKKIEYELQISCIFRLCHQASWCTWPTICDSLHRIRRRTSTEYQPDSLKFLNKIVKLTLYNHTRMSRQNVKTLGAQETYASSIGSARSYMQSVLISFFASIILLSIVFMVWHKLHTPKTGRSQPFQNLSRGLKMERHWLPINATSLIPNNLIHKNTASPRNSQSRPVSNFSVKGTNLAYITPIQTDNSVTSSTLHSYLERNALYDFHPSESTGYCRNLFESNLLPHASNNTCQHVHICTTVQETSDEQCEDYHFANK
ncbi:hypothetical protein P879_01654 [Paragonimus westermani]|uniref:Uncharacterized protein n=1 Tax=Paragonimus westermani TaxID=34504 RepID=A0A8T0DVV9_9TREM|nr:hypothetical protein P879_01654 [Paragonimus westermani]